MDHSDLVYVKRVPGKGRGVFARAPIAKGAVIETVPVLVVPARFVVGGFGNPELNRFFFIKDRANLAVALGYGSLYNHSYRPNARYDDLGPKSMVFTALRRIRADEEITINYNWDPRDRTPVGFEVV